MKKLFKEQGIILANLYLEVDDSHFKNMDMYNLRVTVFGEFSRPNIWQHQVPCTFDSFFKCYKSDVVPIKVGDSFKFVVKNLSHNGRQSEQTQYLTSLRYALTKDQRQITNNMFHPKQIKRICSSSKNVSKSNSLRESLTTQHETCGFSDGPSNKYNRSFNGCQLMTNQWSYNKNMKQQSEMSDQTNKQLLSHRMFTLNPLN